MKLLFLLKIAAPLWLSAVGTSANLFQPLRGVVSPVAAGTGTGKAAADGGPGQDPEDHTDNEHQKHWISWSHVKPTPNVMAHSNVCRIRTANKNVLSATLTMLTIAPAARRIAGSIASALHAPSTSTATAASHIAVFMLEAFVGSAIVIVVTVALTTIAANWKITETIVLQIISVHRAQDHPNGMTALARHVLVEEKIKIHAAMSMIAPEMTCLLYTSDAADE
mgnify:CR=1 FL=1